MMRARTKEMQAIKRTLLRISWILLIGIFSTVACFAQKEIAFMKSYGGDGPDRGIHIIQSTDDHFLIVGNTTTMDNKLDVILLKCNSQGDTLWTRRYGGPMDDNGWCIKETSDKGFIITGFTQSYGAQKNDVLLIRTDSEGKELWHRTYGGPGDDIAWSVALNQDGGFTIAAQTNSFGEGKLDAYLIRTDARGDTLWTKTFGGPEIDRVFSVDLSSTGNILLAGITYSFGAGDRDAFLLHTNPEGELLWQRTYGGPGYDNAHSVILNHKDEILLTGYGHFWGQAGEMDMFLKQISLDGESAWTHSYGGKNNDRAMTVIELQDGGYMLTGFTQSFGSGEWDAYVVKTGPEGQAEWSGAYGTPAPDYAYDLVQSRRGNYYFTGWSHGSGHPEGNLLLFKLPQ